MMRLPPLKTVAIPLVLIMYVVTSNHIRKLIEQSLVPVVTIKEQEVQTLHEESTIRQWGCDRTETPLIYVHIGKSGGGNVRARFAASAINVTKTEWRGNDNSFYPVTIEHNKTTAAAQFCNSGHINYRPKAEGRMYEGFTLCNATTPLGLLGCPEPLAHHKRSSCDGSCDPWSDTCHQVYVGHNLLGNELHWLPPTYLQNWWKSTQWSHHDTGNMSVANYIKTLQPRNRDWCPEVGKPRPTLPSQYTSLYETCQKMHSKRLDTRARDLFSTSTSTHIGGDVEHDVDFGSLYASMPVLRTVIVRDPFSWLVSKFFWHLYHEADSIPMVCDDVEVATRNDGTTLMSYHASTITEEDNFGWAHQFAMEYLTYLCGIDCYLTAFSGVSTIERMERQAASNLRQSFAVVGVLEDGEDNFFDMVSARVRYIDMSLNPHIEGSSHRSGGGEESTRCKAIFNDPGMQQKMIDGSPAIAALVRLFRVGKEVNKFQKEELASCSGFKFS